MSTLYTTGSAVKAAARITDSVDDTLINAAVESASRLIDGYCGRAFYAAGSATRLFSSPDSYVVQIDDLAGTANLVIQSDTAADGTFDTTWDLTDYQLEPLNQFADGITNWPYTRIRAIGDYIWPRVGGEALIKVSASNWGWPAVPDPIEQACVIQALRIFKRNDSPMGVLGFDGMGVTVRVGRALDPDVQMMIDPYRKMRGIY
jgi:hypothetical protein